MSVPAPASAGPTPEPTLLKGGGVMVMRWEQLLFAHWQAPADRIRSRLPAGVELDLWDGRAWVGVVPFLMSGVRPWAVPTLPGFSAFPELNVRTYVRAGGRAGVWFFSLDAGSRTAVRGARAAFHLNYLDARFQVEAREGRVRYQARRTHRGAPPAELDVAYRPTGPAEPSKPGSLEFFLTERYRLFTCDPRGRIRRCEIAHAPWPLQPAEADFRTNTMTNGLGFDLEGPPARLHYAERLDVRAGWLEPV